MTTWPQGISFPPVVSFYMFFPLSFCPLSFSLPLPVLLFYSVDLDSATPPSCPFVTGGIRTITLSTKPCSQQSSIFLWDLDFWGRHCTLDSYACIWFPKENPNTQKFYLLIPSLGIRSFGYSPLTYVVSWPVFVCFCTCCAVDMGWELVKRSVLTKKQVE